MKTLQNNFTTPEQARKLLELGVPADSADCYYNQFSELHFRCEEDYSYDFFHENFMFVPCWTVGRLQEIAKICAKEKEYYYASLDCVGRQEDFVEWWVKHFTLTNNVLFDFSKLEK